MLLARQPILIRSPRRARVTWLLITAGAFAFVLIGLPGQFTTTPLSDIDMHGVGAFTVIDLIAEGVISGESVNGWLKIFHILEHSVVVCSLSKSVSVTYVRPTGQYFAESDRMLLNQLGFRLETRGFAHGPSRRAHQQFIAYRITVPSLPLILVGVLWVAGASYRWYAGRAHGLPGQCPHCRYDLTGNVTGICSECGRVVHLPRGDGWGHDDSE